ncbi:P-loop containing nucleoside triphosphate hydrolase protein [Aspergillus neoniger CBS 115656]|uniref:P-loop containing nucleoside triphosphate hydrolase protein n=1 Tax=Aspergillus neoniger (strain CBS 115656) TaxID=1448310 RepID=A0A318Y6V0_ASPNB|nr:P-loop containing nucleoside triphosphate hydrolase protein [Aspergillus neoniger CBS 115656]PYH29257.1 P-loop containing nucleoside triphosphate hydrolase protein [Aspergillus neoniger CBS 115656]
MMIFLRRRQAQKEWIERVQTRVTATSSMLRDIKSIKMLGLSQVLLSTTSKLRKIELKISERFRKLLIWEIVISNVPTEFAPFATFAVYTIIAVVKHDKTLLSSQAFTSLSLISLVTSPLITFVQAVPSVRQAMSCYLRIEEYCEKEPAGLVTHTASSPVLSLTDNDRDVELRSFQPKSEYSATPVSFERANVGWAKAGENKLHDITLRVGSGVTMLIGPVGSGKSTLLCSLLGETVIKSGDVRVEDHQMAYCSQAPFIMNDTVRQNITFGSPFDPKWYEFAIWACGLKEDLSDMPGGDLYRAGTNGLSLSGGQKQRVALCRAIYSRRRLVVLDDVFSGLDSSNTRIISTRLFGPNGYFRRPGMTVLLATHTEHLFQYADDIVVLEEVSTVGTADHAASATQEGDELSNTAAKPSVPDSQSPLRREGTWSVYKYYFRSAGFIPFATCLAFIVVEAVSGDFTTLWIQWWVEANERSPNKDAGVYLGVYAALFVVQLVGNVGGLWLLIINIINNTAFNLHTDLLTATLRFSQDMELIDMMLPLIASMYLTGNTRARFCFLGYHPIQRSKTWGLGVDRVQDANASHYRIRKLRGQIGHPLHRQQVPRSCSASASDQPSDTPEILPSHFSAEAVHGVTTLRAFGMNPWFQEKLHMLLDKSQRPFYMLYCIQQWLTLVMGLIVAALAVIIVAMTTSLADQYNGAAVGVTLSLILTFNSTISSTLRSWTSLETTIGAVSRVQRFVRDTPREANHDLMGSVLLGVSGHSQFTIAFENVTAGYSQASPPVLKNLSLTIRHGEKVAICGASVQKISIGGCDISELERQAIHSAINVIPQDSFLLSGTVRFNLDPFGMTTDERITSGLQKVGLWNRISTDGGLDMDMSSISTWSVGERQLLALARALVVPRPILILDEATSSVDRETEAFMQEIIEQNFRHQTVIAVIHRFAYIDRFDRVVFLKDGEMLECDVPHALLGRECNFRQLYRAWERA